MTEPTDSNRKTHDVNTPELSFIDFVTSFWNETEATSSGTKSIAATAGQRAIQPKSGPPETVSDLAIVGSGATAARDKTGTGFGIANKMLVRFEDVVARISAALPSLEIFHSEGTAADNSASSFAKRLVKIADQRTYRDEHDQQFAETVTRTKDLKPDDLVRIAALSNLIDHYDHPGSYAEKLAAAHALLTFCAGADGTISKTIGQHDVFVPEKRTKAPGAETYTTIPAHHEQQDLDSADVQRFIANSAPEIEKRTTYAITDGTAEKPNSPTASPKVHRGDYVSELANIFQNSPCDSPEKRAAAIGLARLFPGDKDPDVLKPIEVVHNVYYPRVGHRAAGVREESQDISKAVTKYLATCSDGLLGDTAEQLTNPGNPAKKEALIARAARIFLDSPAPADSALLDAPTRFDKTEAAAALLALETLPVTEKVGTITREQVVQYLQEQTSDTAPPLSRFIAAETLFHAHLLTAAQHRKILESIATSDTTPDYLMALVRKDLGLDDRVEAARRAEGGRTIKNEPESKQWFKTDTSTGDSNHKLQPGKKELRAKENFEVTIKQLLQIPELSKTIDPAQIEAMKKELEHNEFGPASRAVYNSCAQYINEQTTAFATTHAALGHVPEGCPIEVPTNPVTGRAISQELYRSELMSGELKLKLPPAVAGELPDVPRLSQAVHWCEYANSELSTALLRQSLKDDDKFIDSIDDDHALQAWRSHDGMSVKEMRELWSERFTWIQLAKQLRGNAESIAKFHKGTQSTADDHNSWWRLNVTRLSAFSDEALQKGIFPGDIVRNKEGDIIDFRLDLPKTLDPKDPENQAKIQKIKLWLETYGPKVDQVNSEILKHTGTPLLWANVPAEGIDEKTGQQYNQIRYRFTSASVMVTMPDGSKEQRYKVVSETQKAYAHGLSYGGEIGDVRNVGKPEYSGAVVVNGKKIDYDEKDKDGVAVTVGDKHAHVRTDASGLVFIKCDCDIFINAELANGNAKKDKWIEVTPGAQVTLGAPPPVELLYGVNESGAIVVAGKPLLDNQTVEIGADGKTMAPAGSAEATPEKPALLMRRQPNSAYGRCEISDNDSTKGTYVNGHKIESGKWTDIGPDDKVTIGTPAPPHLDIDSDVRLYKANDWAAVTLDGGVQIMQADSLNSWATEAAAWHWGGIAASAAMDVGMLISGTIEFKGASILAAQAEKQVGKELAGLYFKRLLATEGAKQALWHQTLGLTGLAAQAIKNNVPYGDTIMDARGYVMMAQIIKDGIYADASKFARRLFGAADAAKAESSLSGVIQEMSAGYRMPYNGTHKLLLLVGAYYIPEIAARQAPGIAHAISGQPGQAKQDIDDGVSLRANNANIYEESPQTAMALADHLLQLSDTATQKVVLTEIDRANLIAQDKDQQKFDAYRQQLTAQYLDARWDSPEKFAAAAGLVVLAHSTGGSTDVLGRRWTGSDELPDDVTSTNLENYFKSLTPLAISSADKVVEREVQALDIKLAAIADGKGTTATKLKLADQYLLHEYTSSDNPARQVAAAMHLAALNGRHGVLPENAVLGTVEIHGQQIEIKAKDINETLTHAQSHRAEQLFRNYLTDYDGASENVRKVVDIVKHAAALPRDSKERTTQLQALQSVFQTSLDKEERACAGLGLIYLTTDPRTGAIPSRLSLVEYQVQKMREVVSESGTDKNPHREITREKYTESVSKEVTASDVISFLQEQAPAFSSASRLAAGDLLYSTGQLPAYRSSQIAERTGVLLNILQSEDATPQQKQQAIVDAHGVDLADIMEVLRYETEPRLARQSMEAGRMETATLFGRDSDTIEAALRQTLRPPADSKIANDPQSKDVRALAAAVLLANAQPEAAKRAAELQQIESDFERSKQQPGQFYERFFSAQADKLKKGQELHGQQTDQERLESFRAALIFSEAGNAKEFGITDSQLAHTFYSAFNPLQPSLAVQVLAPLAKYADLLDPAEKRSLRQMFVGSAAMPGLLTHPTLETSPNWADEVALKVAAISLLDQFEPTLKFEHEAKDSLFGSLTVGSYNFDPSVEVRLAAVGYLGEHHAGDLDTAERLKPLLGLEGKGDPSARVRRAAFDIIEKLNPPAFHQLCVDLLAKERDAGLLEKIEAAERRTAHLDPDSQVYREHYRLALSKLQQAGAHPLSNAESYLEICYPLLTARGREPQALKTVNNNMGFLPTAFDEITGTVGQSVVTETTISRYQIKKQMLQQLSSLAEQAGTPAGDEARHALCWILMTNGKSIDTADRQLVLQKTADALLHLCRCDNPRVKKDMGPIMTLCLANQDRLPPAVRKTLLEGVLALKPGTTDSPISKEDAQTAILAALERQFSLTPRRQDALSDSLWRQSQDLQLKLLDAYAQFAGPEGIPILEALAEQRLAYSIQCGTDDRIKRVYYPDQSWREVEEDQNKRVWKETTEAPGVPKQVWIREGQSDIWYEQQDIKKQHPIYGTAEFDQQTGDFSRVDRFKHETVITPALAVISKDGGHVTDVRRPDNSSDHLSTDGNTFAHTDSNQHLTVFTRSGKEPGQWRADCDPSRVQHFCVSFDEAGNLKLSKDQFAPCPENAVSMVPEHQAIQRKSYFHSTPVRQHYEQISRPDGSSLLLLDGQPALAKPGVADVGPESMPLVQEKAAQLLGRLRDGIDILADTSAASPTLPPNDHANKLRQTLDNTKATTEDVCKAIVAAGLPPAPPIAGPSDPRHDLMLSLLHDPHERIQLAAAHVLLRSELKDDRQCAARVIADISINGSRLGYRDDATKLIHSFDHHNSDGRPSSPAAAGESLDASTAEMLSKAVRETPVAPHREEKAPLPATDDQTLELQRKYESAKSALLRDSQIDLARCDEKEWWHKYPLLWAQNVRDKQAEHITNSGRLDTISFLCGTTADTGRAMHALSQPVTDHFYQEFDGLCHDALKAANNVDFTSNSDSAKDGKDCCAALSYIVLSNGFPLPSSEDFLSRDPETHAREKLTYKAAETICQIYKDNKTAANYVEQFIQAALVGNPGIDRNIRALFARTIAEQALKSDADSAPHLSRDKAAMLLVAALESEELSMPEPGTQEFAESLEVQAEIIKNIDKLNETIAMPALQAIAERHPDEEIATLANVFERLRDGTKHLQAQAVPYTGDPSQLASALEKRLATPVSGPGLSEEGLCCEIFRLSHTNTPRKPGEPEDPREKVLREALYYPNDRVRMAAARALHKMDPSDLEALNAFIRLIGSERGGLVSEAFEILKAETTLNPIRSQDDPRRPLLLHVLEGNETAWQKQQLAAAWLLSGSTVRSDFEAATMKLSSILAHGRSPLRLDGKELQTSEWAGGLLRDIVNYGSDSEQQFALDSWIKAWDGRDVYYGNAPLSLKPPDPAAVERGRAREFIKRLSPELKLDLIREYYADPSHMSAAILHMQQGLAITGGTDLLPEDSNDEDNPLLAHKTLLQWQEYGHRLYNDSEKSSEHPQTFKTFAYGWLQEHPAASNEKIPLDTLADAWMRKVYYQAHPSEAPESLSDHGIFAQGHPLLPAKPRFVFELPVKPLIQEQTEERIKAGLMARFSALVMAPPPESQAIAWRPAFPGIVKSPEFLSTPPLWLLEPSRKKLVVLPPDLPVIDGTISDEGLKTYIYLKYRQRNSGRRESQDAQELRHFGVPLQSYTGQEQAAK